MYSFSVCVCVRVVRVMVHFRPLEELYKKKVT